MTNVPVKASLLSLSDVCVAEEDGVRYVTDRFVLWALDRLPRGFKVADVLRHQPVGWWKLSASGVAGPSNLYGSVPTVGRLLPSDSEAASWAPLERLPMIVDHQKDGARVYKAADGALVGLDARLDLSAFELHVSPDGRKVAIMRNDEVVGIIMPVRIGTQLDTIRAALAPALEVAV